MVMGFFQQDTAGFTLKMRMGARNTVPSSAARMVALGGLPHLLQPVFLLPLEVGGDGGALHPDLQRNGLCRLRVTASLRFVPVGQERS